MAQARKEVRKITHLNVEETGLLLSVDLHTRRNDRCLKYGKKAKKEPYPLPDSSLPTSLPPPA